MRERIDISEIEAQTKIRAKYLRALENEEWGLLPGPTFVKSFLRTYAQALGLDGKALVEEYRLQNESPSEGMLEPIVAPSQRNRRRGRGGSAGGPSRGYMIAVGSILAVIVVLIVALVSGGSSNSPAGPGSTAPHTTSSRSAKDHAGNGRPARAASDIVALSLTPTSAVYVCLLGDGGRKLIPGIELQPGKSTATYHARHFEITLGNNAVTMYIDGRPRTVPASSQAIGYSITKAQGRKTLTAAQQPTCK